MLIIIAKCWLPTRRLLEILIHANYHSEVLVTYKKIVGNLIHANYHSEVLVTYKKIVGNFDSC